ncbi:unnamed protein product [Tenebrio molitor]|nr:unnamed protein product [Tenebrio molitor]
MLNKNVNVKYLKIVPFILEDHDSMLINKLIKDLNDADNIVIAV